MKAFLIFCILSLTLNSFGQDSVRIIDTKHCDCTGALLTDDAEFAPMELPTGYGEKLEIKGNSIRNRYFPSREHNTMWMRFKFLADTEFGFVLKPSIPTDDLDFTIWKVQGANYCDSILNGAVPVRSNLSRKDPAAGSVTGLKPSATIEFAKAGRNPSFSKSIPVKKGEEYIILIDAPYGTNGSFTAQFDYLREPVVEVIDLPEQMQEPEIVYPRLLIKVVNENGGVEKNVELDVKGMPENDSLYQTENGYYVISRLRKFKNYIIDVDKQGFLQKSDVFLCRELVEDTVIIQIDRLKIGSVLQFKNILFLPDQASIMKSSYSDLRKIKSFLEVNPAIHVEIMGHVNGEGRKKKIFKELSQERAEAILDYLIAEGVSSNRMKAVGYGADKMVYPRPSNENEARMNRRVEVKVTKL